MVTEDPLPPGFVLDGHDPGTTTQILIWIGYVAAFLAVLWVVVAHVLPWFARYAGRLVKSFKEGMKD